MGRGEGGLGGFCGALFWCALSLSVMVGNVAHAAPFELRQTRWGILNGDITWGGGGGSLSLSVKVYVTRNEKTTALLALGME